MFQHDISVLRDYVSKHMNQHIKSAEPITKSDEKQLWESGVLGRTETPRALQNAIFYVGR